MSGSLSRLYSAVVKPVWSLFYPVSARRVCLTEMTDHLVVHVLFMLHLLPETTW